MIHIVIHVLPHEIDYLEQLMIHLKKSSYHLPEDHNIFLDVTLNTNLVNWKQSLLDKEFFINKAENVVLGIGGSWTKSNLDYGTVPWVEGCNDARSNAIRTTDLPYIMYLDVDNVFSETMLGHMYQALYLVNRSEYSIVTPETTRMWDSSWDIITNDRYIKEEASHEIYDNRDPYSIRQRGSINIREISGFKFAGWGTTISTKLARLIDVPDSLGSYGLDDTFLMFGSQLLKNAGYDVKQHVLENEVIIENNKFRFNPYKKYLSIIDKKAEFLSKAHLNFNPELEKLKLRI